MYVTGCDLYVADCDLYVKEVPIHAIYFRVCCTLYNISA